MQRDGLWLRLYPEGDGTAELVAGVRSGAFSGGGAAWCNEDALRAFAAALRAFPLGEEARRGIASGYGSLGAELEQVHVSVSIYPTDSLGHLGVRVRLATAWQARMRPEDRHSVETEFPTNYTPLAHFADQLDQLLDGKLARAELLADQAT